MLSLDRFMVSLSDPARRALVISQAFRHASRGGTLAGLKRAGDGSVSLALDLVPDPSQALKSDQKIALMRELAAI
jgi:hypothetical protein